MLRWAALTGLVLLAIARPAQGIVLTPPTRVHRTALPANGVLLFMPGTAGDTGTVTVSGPDGEIAGTTSEIRGYYFGWRADDPPELGTYHWTLGSDTYITVEGNSVAIVEPYEPASHELNLALILVNTEVAGGELVCCQPEPESRTLNDGCFYSEVTQQPELRVVWASPLPPEHATQYLYQLTAWPETPVAVFVDPPLFAVTSQELRLPVVPADEYCVTIEAQSLIDDQIFSTSACAQHTLPEPTFSPRTIYQGAFTRQNCPEPPEDFEDVWCEALGPGCTTYLSSFPTDSALAEIEACEQVYEICGLEPPALPLPVEPFPDGGTGVDAGVEDPLVEPVPMGNPDDDEPAFACSCRAPGGPSGAASALPLAIGLLFLTRVRRERRRR